MVRLIGNLKTALKIAWWNFAILTTFLVCVEALAFGYYGVRRVLSGYNRVNQYVKTEVSKMPHNGYPSADQSWFGDYWKEFNDSTYAAAVSDSYSNWHRHPFKGKYINVD